MYVGLNIKAISTDINSMIKKNLFIVVLMEHIYQVMIKRTNYVLHMILTITD